MSRNILIGADSEKYICFIKFDWKIEENLKQLYV